MAVTRLKRKELRNSSRAINRKERIRQLTALPTIKNVDVEAIKAEWAAQGKGQSSKPAADQA